MVETKSKLAFLTDIRQTPEYAQFMMKIGWKVEKLGETQVFIRKLPLVPFSVIKVLRYKPPINLDKIKRHRPILVKLHPFELSSNKFLRDSSPLIPTKTIWIDLTKSEPQLLSEMKQKTRYNLKKSSCRQFEIIRGDRITDTEFNDFYNLWKKNKPYDWLFKPSFYELQSLVESFNKKCFFVFAAGAACLILTSSNMAFYWHNCSNKEGKKLFAPTLCVWQAIIEAKKRKLAIFDLEGIWDERLPRVNTGWKGFSRFKQGFGGETVSFS